MEIKSTTTDLEIRQYIEDCDTKNIKAEFFTLLEDFSLYGRFRPSSIYGFPLIYK